MLRLLKTWKKKVFDCWLNLVFFICNGRQSSTVSFFLNIVFTCSGNIIVSVNKDSHLNLVRENKKTEHSIQFSFIPIMFQCYFTGTLKRNCKNDPLGEHKVCLLLVRMTKNVLLLNGFIAKELEFRLLNF